MLDFAQFEMSLSFNKYMAFPRLFLPLVEGDEDIKLSLFPSTQLLAYFSFRSA